MSDKVLPDINVVNNSENQQAVRLEVNTKKGGPPVANGVIEVPGVENFSTVNEVTLSEVDTSYVHYVAARSSSAEARSEVTVTEDGFPDHQQILVEIKPNGEMEVEVTVA